MNIGRFRSMGCEIVVGGATAAEFAQIRELFDAARPDVQPLSRRQRVEPRQCGPRRGSVSPEFARTLAVAFAAAVATDGLVDATVGGAVEAAGYDRDFALIEPSRRRLLWPRCPVCARCAWRMASSIARSERTLDLNGVVKSLAVDDACVSLAEAASSAQAAMLRHKANVSLGFLAAPRSRFEAAASRRAVPPRDAGCGPGSGTIT